MAPVNLAQTVQEDQVVVVQVVMAFKAQLLVLQPITVVVVVVVLTLTTLALITLLVVQVAAAKVVETVT